MYKINGTHIVNCGKYIDAFGDRLYDYWRSGIELGEAINAEHTRQGKSLSFDRLQLAGRLWDSFDGEATSANALEEADCMEMCYYA